MFCCCCCCLFFPSRGIQVVLRYYNFNLGKILLRKYFGLQLKAAGELHFPKTFLDPWNPMSTMKHIFRARLTPFSSKKRNHHNSQTPGTESLQIPRSGERRDSDTSLLTLQQDTEFPRGSWPRQRAELTPGESERGEILWFKRSHLIHTLGIWTHKKERQTLNQPLKRN